MQQKSPLLEEFSGGGETGSSQRDQPPPSQNAKRAPFYKLMRAGQHVDAFERYRHQHEGGASEQAPATEATADAEANAPPQNEEDSPEEKALKAVTIDIFSLLDVDCDHTLYNDEITDLWKAMDGSDLTEEQKAWVKDQKQKLLKVDKHDLKALLDDASKKDIEAEKVQRRLYRIRAGSLACCPCHYIRKKMVGARFDRKTAEEAHYGWVSIITNFGIQMVHLLDLLTDFVLAVQMYAASRPIEEQERWRTYWGFDVVHSQCEGKAIGECEPENYDIAFIWIMMAIFSPYIIQFSSMINAFFVKGIFEDERWSKFNCGRKLYLFLNLSFLGLFILPFLDFFIKVRATILLLLLPLHFTKFNGAYRSLRKSLESFYNQTFLLTFYEVESFEKQKKHTQLLFEDLLMLVLNFFIFAEILVVPILSEKTIDKKPFYLQVASTCMSILTTSLSLLIESHGLDEPFLEFIMTSVKAKQDWVPHGEKIRYAKIKQDIDFSRIEFKMSKVTDLLGLYKTFEYQFNEHSLQKLATQILAGQDFRKLGIKIENENIRKGKQVARSIYHKMPESGAVRHLFEAKIKLGFSVFHVSAHMFLHFIDRIQSDHPDFVANNIDFSEISWEQLISNSFELGHFVYEKRRCCSRKKKKPKMMDAMTVGGKRLLQICIDNEHESNFKLQKLMELLLEQRLCDPNVMDFQGKSTLLTYSLLNKKHRSFELLVKYSDVDPNLENKDGTTTYGVLFYQSFTAFFTEAGYKPKEHLQYLFDHCKIPADIHKPTINIAQNGVMRTPIFSYFQRCGKEITLDNNVLSFNEKHLKSYFGKDSLGLKDPIEYFEILSLFFTSNIQKKAQAFFQQKVTEPIDHIFRDARDKNDNNLMHVTGATFSESQFHKYTTDKSFDQVKVWLQEQMLQTNKQGLTPINVLVQSDPPLKRLERLLDFDLLPKGSFTACEDELIDFITRKVIKNQNDTKLKGKKVFTKQPTNKKYFEIFEKELQAYSRQKESFNKRGFGQLFDQVLSVPELDEKMQRQSYAGLEINSALNWEKLPGQIIVKQMTEVRDVKVEPQVTSSALKVEESINTSTDFTQRSISRTTPRRQQQGHYMLEACLNMLIDVSSVLDLISDIVILRQLIIFKHSQWLFLSISTMLCPYFAVYTSLMNFQIDLNKRIRRDSKKKIKSCCKQLMQTFFIFPSGLMFLIVYDILYSLANFLCMPALIILSGCRGKNWIQPFENFLDIVMYQITGMNYMDIKGFRSQRTILQLQLESLPQIGLQTYMLVRLHQLKNGGNADTIGVNPQAIEVSVAMACIHVFLEFANLYIEARTWKTNFRDYMIACHNAKQGWIAQRTAFIASNDQHHEHAAREPIMFDDKEDFFCNQGFSVSFNFTDLSIESLINIISNLPKIDNRARRTTVKLGKCISELSVEKFLQLLTLSFQKVNLVFTDPHIHVRCIFYNDLQFMKSVRHPFGDDLTGEPLLIDMVSKDYHQVVQVLIALHAKFDLKTKENDESLLKIAFSKQYPETMKVLMGLIHLDERYVKESICDDEMFYDEIFLKEDTKTKPLCPLIFLEPKCLIPFEMQISLIYNLPRLLRADEDVARDQYDLVFGAYMPNITFKVGEEMESCLPIIEKWLGRYPEQYTVSAFGNKASLDSVFLSSFVGFRRELYLLKESVDGIISKVFRRTIDIEKYEFELPDLVNVYKLMNNVEDITNFDLARCDEVVRNFGLDKMRDVYFYESRRFAADQKGLTRSETVSVIAQEQFTKYMYTVPEDVVAIKSLNLTVMKKGLSSPETFKLYVEYYIGHQKAELKPPITLKADPDAEAAQDSGEIQLLSTCYNSHAANDDVAVIKLNQTLLMNIDGANTLTFKFKAEKAEGLDYHFNLTFDFYLKREADLMD